jgi:DNA-binding transcriptional ArsR family regulator
MRHDDLELVWKALADPSRRRILDLLKQRPHTTGELCKEFAVTRFAVMKHLRVLEQAELITVQHRGRERWNYLNPVPLQMVYERWISPYVGMWASSLLDLKRTVEKHEKKRRELRHGRPGDAASARV